MTLFSKKNEGFFCRWADLATGFSGVVFSGDACVFGWCMVVWFGGDLTGLVSHSSAPFLLPFLLSPFFILQLPLTSPENES